MISAVTFDCWGTLLTDHRFERATELRVEALVEVSDGSLDPAAARELLARAWATHHEAWLRGRQYGSPGMARFCVEELGLDAASCLDVLRAAFEDAGRSGEVDALPGAGDTLRALHEAGIRTALVCDTGLTPGRIVREFLAGLGLAPYLGFLAFSDEVGVPKPDPRIFREALGAIDAEPARAAHIGDLLRTDVAGARAIGMRTVRITAVNDDAARGFSWDPRAVAGDGRDVPLAEHTFGEADAVVGSHAEIPMALAAFGASFSGSGTPS